MLRVAHMIRRRAVFAPFGLVATFLVIAACNEGGVASPSNTPHGSRCLMDTDCMGGYECNKAKGDILGECSQKTMGGPAAAGGGGGSAKPAGSGGPGPASSASSGSGKPADPPKGNGKSQTPEPLPPPKPPKDAKPADTSTFSP